MLSFLFFEGGAFRFRSGLKALAEDESQTARIRELQWLELRGFRSEKAASLNPDVILMDVHLKGMSGLEATRAIHKENPDIRVIGVSMVSDEIVGEEMMEAGASAYLPKDGSVEVLEQTIRQVYEEKLSGVKTVMPKRQRELE